MGFVTFFETHILGKNLQLSTWTVNEWLNIFLYISRLLIYVTVHILIILIYSILSRVINSTLYSHFRRLYITFWKCIPICGEYKVSFIEKITFFVTDILLPRLSLAKKIIEILFHFDLSQELFQNKNNIQILFTGESEELQLIENNILLTTIFISNHRSINDYALISHILQHIMKPNGEQISKYDLIHQLLFNNDHNRMERLLKIRFVGWGEIFNSIRFSVMKNIILRDENYTIESNDITKMLQENGNQILVIFPEVNILTTELSIIQRKLNEKYYPFVTKYYNVLYPRFKTFVSAINSLKTLSDIPVRNFNRRIINRNFLVGAKVMLHSNITKLIKEEDKIENILLQNTNIDKITSLSSVEKVSLNNFVYDFTIIYYRVKITEKAHDHNNGSLKVHEGIQLEQIAPSFLEILHANFSESIDPIFIMVDLRKHNIQDILPLKPKKLERWLETQWLNKEKLIKTNEECITLK